MLTIKHHSLRMLAVPIGYLMVVLVLPALAQDSTPVEVVPIVEDRVEGIVIEPLLEDEDYPPIEEDVTEKSEGWEISVMVSAAYDDNVFLSSSDAEQDMVFEVAPAVAYSKGDDEKGVGAFVAAGYRPTLVFYAENDSDRRIDHEALLLVGWRGRVTTLTYEGKARVLGDSTAETGRPTDRFETENEVRFGWAPREKVKWEGALGYEARDYADSFYFDSSKMYGEVALRFAYSPKTELGAAYQVGRFEVEGSGPQTTNQVTGWLRWQPREKIRVNLEAGLEHRDFDRGSDVNPVFAGRIDWQLRKETAVYVTAYMRQETSSFYAGQNYAVKGVTGGFSQRLGSDWTLSVDGGYETNDFEQVSGTGGAEREDRLWFIRPALVWRINGETDLAFFYRISDNQSSDPGFGYERQMIGVRLEHKF